jgi:RimJ/RimL family protein N-acetyltransferase
VLALVNDPDWLRYIGDRSIRSIAAASATLGHAESALGLRRVAAIVSPGNLDSRRLLAKVGMQLERVAHPPLDANAVCLYASTRPDPMAGAPC